MDSIQPFSTPRGVEIAITGRCNLNCEYCFYANEMVALGDLPAEHWLTFFEELGGLAVMSVTLTGGEAFTRPDLFELIDGIIGNSMRYAILSNGTLITPKLLENFAIGKRRQRLDYIQVSIDGSRAEVHDKSRPNSFKRALRGLQLLKESGFPVTVRVTINRHNLHDLENIAYLLLEEIGLPSFSTNDAMPIGSGCQNEPDIALTPAEQIIAMETMKRLLDRYPGRLASQAGPQAKLQAYSEMEHARLTGERTSRWKMGYLTACGCVFSKLSVMHDGTIVPCHMLPSLSLGNITKDSFAEVWRSHSILESLRSRRQISMENVPGCQGCEWTSYCNGGCPGLAHQMTGDFNRANPKDCYRRFLIDTGEFHAT
jgi:SynChlorMet cassette radical SAM/SPASM protein ScmE